MFCVVFSFVILAAVAAPIAAAFGTSNVAKIEGNNSCASVWKLPTKKKGINKRNGTVKIKPT